MAARPMSAKRFATSKLSGKTTADGFLAAHRDFLRAHEFLSPVLDAYEQGELLPTPTLQAIQSALMIHVLESEAKTEEAKMAERAASGSSKVRKPKDPNGKQVATSAYSVTLMCKVYNKVGDFTIEVGTVEEIVGYKIRTIKGDIIVKTKDEADGHIVLEKLIQVGPAVWKADDFGAAMRLADRRLFQREDSVYAIIRNNFDRPIDTHVQRGDAIERMLRQPKGGATRKTVASSTTLKWHGKAKQDRSIFSRG